MNANGPIDFLHMGEVNEPLNGGCLPLLGGNQRFFGDFWPNRRRVRELSDQMPVIKVTHWIDL